MSKSDIVLSPGEEIILELEAELWASSSNPIARLFGAVLRIIYMILGIRAKGFVVLTNKRIVEQRQNILCWCFNAAKEVKYVLPSSVKEVGYAREATFCGCFCQAYTFYYDAFTQRTSILLKGADEDEAIKVTNAFYNFIEKANA